MLWWIVGCCGCVGGCFVPHPPPDKTSRRFRQEFRIRGFWPRIMVGHAISVGGGLVTFHDRSLMVCFRSQTVGVASEADHGFLPPRKDLER